MAASVASSAVNVSVPKLDLPKDIKEPVAREGSILQVEQLLPKDSQDRQLRLEHIAASLAALLHKYTMQDEVAVGMQCDGQLTVLSVADASSVTLSSLEAAAVAATPSSASEAKSLRRSLQVSVFGGRSGTGTPSMSEFNSAEWPLLEICIVLGAEKRGEGSPNVLIWLYRADRFSDSFVLRAQQHLAALLASDLCTPVSKLNILSDEEHTQVLHVFNRTGVTKSGLQSVLHALARAAVEHADRVAIQVGDELMSYAELWAFAGRLARAIIAAAGGKSAADGTVRPVAILLDRGPFMIVALLAAWRSGGACMPLDLKTPRARLEHMFADAEVRAVVTRRSVEEEMNWLQGAVLFIDDYESPGASGPNGKLAVDVTDLPLLLDTDDPAYVLFTSGSTGVPKGVVLTHANLVAFLGWHIPYFEMGPEDRVPHMAGLSFDMSMAEIWPTLCVGGRVLPAPDDNIRLVPEALCRWFADNGITSAFLTTQLAESLLLEPSYPEHMKLRHLYTAGEKLHFGPPAHAPFKVVNEYGPTEAFVVTMGAVPHDLKGSPSIGEPVPGSQIYILDANLTPQGVGIFGECYLGGPQVSAGYIKRPEMTAERFVPCPFAGQVAPASAAGPTLWPTGPTWQGRKGPAIAAEGSAAGPGDVAHVGITMLSDAPVEHWSRMYRTGDLVRWMEDGSLDYLGRADCQVKINGQRIELGEIESKIMQHEAVKECCVVCRETAGGKLLVGYWTVSDADTSFTDIELQGWLKTQLPGYMVPKTLMKLPKLPVNANGKVDRKNLPEPALLAQKQLDTEQGTDETEEADSRIATGDIEPKLQAIFEGILGRSPVPVTKSFFELGGHSLSAGRLVNQIRRELGLQVSLTDLYDSPSIQALGALLDTRGGPAKAEKHTSPVRPLSDAYAASFQQRALYQMSQLSSEASTSLNISFCCHVRGPLDIQRLRNAFRALSLRHDALRSTFSQQKHPNANATNDEELQCTVQTAPLLDFQEERAPADLVERLLDEQYAEFDLHRGPLSRVRVLEEASSGAWVLHWTLHHTAADLWSYNVLLDELAFAYEQLRDAPEVLWPQPAPQYRSCITEQAEWLESAAGQKTFNYWLSKLDPPPPALELPTDQRGQSGSHSFTGSKVDFELDEKLLCALQETASQCGATTVYPVLLAAWMVLLSRHAQEEDVCVGTPMACRTSSDAEAAVGYFVNPVCIRATVSGLFSALAAAVATDAREALQHQQVPLSAVCDRLGLEERKLLQGMFVFQTSPNEAYASTLPSFFMGHAGAELRFGKELRLESLALGQRHAQFDIALIMAKGPQEQLIGSFQYSAMHFSREMVFRLQNQYRRILESVASDPRQDVGDIQLFDAEEASRLQQRTMTPWPAELPRESLPELFRKRATENPSAFAIIGPDCTCTYGEVLRRAENIATALLQQQAPPAQEGNPFKNPLVGMMVSPGAWMVAGPLGAWMAGRGYFPVDPNLPLERVQQMTQDARPQCILCESRYQDAANALGFPVVVIEQVYSASSYGVVRRQSSSNTVRRDSSSPSMPRSSEFPMIRPDDCGFLIFTSGSTGRPKGVLLSIRNLLTHVLFTRDHLRLKEGQAVLQHTAWTFDAHINEMWPALLAGSTVVISKRDGSKDFKYLSELIHNQRVSHALFVPSLLAEILETMQLPRILRSLIVAGEATSLSLARRILEAPLTLHNFYGPSEAGIGATIYVLDKIGNMPPGAQSTPIGRPVSWRQVVLLDERQCPAVGRSGQLAIMGEGLALGYLNLPEETKKKFIKTPEAVRNLLPNCGDVMYLTGDVGRYVHEDLLEFVGRIDNQVKLRGQRIELSEIEAALLSVPYVTEAVVMVRSERLLGYFSFLQGVDESAALADCMERARQKLPRYMWPELVPIATWPRGRTGKVDRKALPVPEEVVQEVVRPRSPLESVLLEHFCQSLKREVSATSVLADFFSLGGTSLKAAALLSQLRANVPEAASLQFNELYAHASPAALAAALGAEVREEVKYGPAPAEGLLPASHGQEHMLILHELNPDSGAYNSALLLRLAGSVNYAALSAALQRVVARHDVLRSNLLRDVVEGEPSVVQYSTPAAEFDFQMEYWPAPDFVNPYPKPRRLHTSQRPRRMSSMDVPSVHPSGGGMSTGAWSPRSGSENSSAQNLPISSPNFRIGSPPACYASPHGGVPNMGSRPFLDGTSSPLAGSPRMNGRRVSYQGYASPGPSRFASTTSNVELCFRLDSVEYPSGSSGPCLVPSSPDDARSNGSNQDPQRAVSTQLFKEAMRPFDLRDEPLVRVVLAKVNPNSHLLLVNLHHSVTDGRSMHVFRQELCEAYTAACQGREPKLPALALQYADVSYWQRQWLSQGMMAQHLEYWRNQLEGLQSIQLPGDFPRPAELKLDGAQVPIQVSAEMVAKLRALARGNGATLFCSLFAAYAALLGRYAGSADVAIASIVANRDGPEVESMMGYFVNTLIFRAKLSGNFNDLIRQVKDVTVGAFANSMAPYASVLEEAKLDASAIPAMFVLQDSDDGKWSMNGLEVEQVEMPRTSALFDVTLELEEDRFGSGCLNGTIVYNIHLWTKSRAQQFAESFLELAAAAIEQPKVELPLLQAAPEKHRMQMMRWGGCIGAGVEPAETMSAVEMFEANVKKHRRRIACFHGQRQVTYAELGDRVWALKRSIQTHIKQSMAPNAEAVVGILLGRSVDMMVALWAVLGAGAAYVPIDPEYPAERIGHILSNAKPQLMLCKKEHIHLASGVQPLPVEEWPEPVSQGGLQGGQDELEGLAKVAPKQLAYIIYTSGSTGRPKGVAVEHQGVANMVREQIALMEISEKDRVLQFFKPAFDGAVQEYLSTPCCGAGLVLWDSDDNFGDVMASKQVSVATLTPSALSVLNPDDLPYLFQIAVAAEACPPALIATWALNGRRVVNAYGPSENTVVSTFCELSVDMQHAPIGCPLGGVQCYVLEPSRLQSLQPVGVPGELCLGGVQLARGYYGDEAKTSEKFVTNPLNGSRMYCSGDLVAWHPSGQLLYLGRNDEMVKIRGFRVELTEVEAALAAAGAQSVAVSLNQAKDALWAWVTPESLHVPMLKDMMQKALPQYMVPQRIFAVGQLHLTPNGKIDKKRLLAEAASEVSGSAEESEEEFVAPEGVLEERLGEVVAAVLGRERISMTTELKAAGMTSLKSVMLAQKLRDASLDVPLGNLYQLNTVREIAEWVQEERQPTSFVLQVDGENSNSRRNCGACRDRCTTLGKTLTWPILRCIAWIWIAGVVIWPAVAPLWLASHTMLPRFGIWGAIAWVVIAAYPLYMLGVALLVVLTKWMVVGTYRSDVVPVDSFAFLRWWTVDRLCTFVNDMVFGPLRGGPLYFAYLRLLGLRAQGYSRIDTRFVSEFDLIELGQGCVVAEGAKLRPGVIEADVLHLRPMVFGNRCAIGENAVCTSGCAAGNDVTLQPLSFLSGRTRRTLPDGSVWKGTPLVQSRQQPMRLPPGHLAKDFFADIISLLASLALIVLCSTVGYAVFGAMARAQGIEWDWWTTPDGWLFAAVWLMFGPPVMASADVLMGYDLAQIADDAAKQIGDSQWVFGLRIAVMVTVAYAAYGWTLGITSALLCRVMRGSRRLNTWRYQVRRVILRITFQRYPAQWSGTSAMALYLRLLGGQVSMSATVAFADPPLEPRKLHIGEGAIVVNATAIGECTVGRRSLVGGGSVMLPHAEVEDHAIVGGGAVVGRPVESGKVLASNPGVILRRTMLSKPPMRPSPALLGWRFLLRVLYPILAPMVTQLILLVTLLPAMYFLTILMNIWEEHLTGADGFIMLSLALAPTYILLGLCLSLIAIVVKWLLLGRMREGGPWRWMGSTRDYVTAFVQSIFGLSSSIYMSMAFGSPMYNGWLRGFGSHIEEEALILAPVLGFETVSIGTKAVIDRDATISGQRLLPAEGGPSEFAYCFSKVRVGTRSTVSISATVVAAETDELSVLAPLSAIGASMRLPSRTFAVGSPPQKFVWSKERDNLVKPSTRPVPRELRQGTVLPQYVVRALNQMKVRSDTTGGPATMEPLVTGAGGFLGRYLVATLLESTPGNVICIVRAADNAAARERVLASLRKAGISSPSLTDRVVGIAGDLSKRHLGLSFSDFQRLAGRATHVINPAAKVNLIEPFETMRKDNVDAVEHLLEFCCAVRPKPMHHISTMGILTPDMLDRHGQVPESAPLGDMSAFPMYGTGDQANGYPYTKWLAEKTVFQAGRRGLQVFVHRVGLCGGHSLTGDVAEDVFFHFLTDVLKLRSVPAMEGDKFNITPVDWVAKGIVNIVTSPLYAAKTGIAVHPAMTKNAITMDAVAEVLQEIGYGGIQRIDFVKWRSQVLANPQQFKSWSFASALSSEGNGIDSMCDNKLGFQAIREAVGERATSSFDPREHLKRTLRYCQVSGLLPPPEAEPSIAQSATVSHRDAARPLLGGAAASTSAAKTGGTVGSVDNV